MLRIPGKTGWAPLPVGYRALEAVFPSSVLATDCSSFDWTLPEWLPNLLLDCRIQQVRLPSPWYVAALKNRWHAVLRSAIVRLPSGRRFQQQHWGVMKSGWFRTIAENSAAQVLINSLAWLRTGNAGPMPTLWAMGDDVLMEWPDDCDVRHFEEQLRTTGILVKSGTRDREFAGFRFGTGTVTPLYPRKHEFLLRYVSPAVREEVATAYTLCYALAEPEQKAWITHYLTPSASINTATAIGWATGLFALEDL